MRNVELIINGVEPQAGVEEAAISGSLAALEHECAEGEICIELTNDAEIHAVNRAFRGVDRPTDVLSFPAFEGEELISEPDGHIGDIMISLDTAARQAEELGHSLQREVKFLAIHGTLHILGYDHMCPEDEEVMTAKQRQIMKRTEESPFEGVNSNENDT